MSQKFRLSTSSIYKSSKNNARVSSTFVDTDTHFRYLTRASVVIRYQNCKIFPQQDRLIDIQQWFTTCLNQHGRDAQQKAGIKLENSKHSREKDVSPTP